MQNKIKGALYGVAIGDALGGPVEFCTAEEIRQKHGVVREMIGGGWLDLQPGEVTDDTQMTLAVAKGITENPDSPLEAIGAHFVQWIQTSPKDVGNTCMSAINGAMRLAARPNRPSNNEWLLASYSTHRHTGGKTAGNGSLMRTVYVGLYYKDIAEITEKAQLISRMTHYDPVTADDCAAYCIIIHNLINSFASRNERLHIISDVVQTYFDLSDRYNIEAIASESFRPNPSGYVVDSFSAALHCIFTTDTFEKAIVKAVNLGGDADTIGAITGGIAGALYGYENIPERWRIFLDRQLAHELNGLTEAAVLTEATTA